VSIDSVPEEILIETLAEVMPTEEGATDLKLASKGSKRTKATKPGHVTSSMPGAIVDVMVKVGDSVKAGDPVLVIEAMKMEYQVSAPIAGTVRAVNVVKGESINPDEALVEIE
jgi:pyruvate carboxylase subunit B